MATTRTLRPSLTRPSTRTLQRAHAETLSILTESLPHLRAGLSQQSAERVAALVLGRLPVQAVAIVNTDQVLAFYGAGSDHHRPGQPFVTDLTREVLLTGETGMVNDRSGVGCPEPGCPLTSAIVAPLKLRGIPVGCLKLYQTDHAPMGPMEMEVARSLARIFSAHLELAELDVQHERIAQAELEALRAQISPHFLFNTLNTIASLIRTSPERAHDMVIDFAEFFRETLKKHGEFGTLAEELDYVDRYLGFERARLGHRLQISREVEPDALEMLLPVLVIQPLVENAVNHGLAPKQDGGYVAVRARRDGANWLITVEDNGVGIPAERIRRVLEPGVGSGLGMGLSNVNQRLISLYGPSYALSIESTSGRGTCVRVRIPRVRHP
ncbi:MAG: histidine kinase [Chloroflexota bacterium]